VGPARSAPGPFFLYNKPPPNQWNSHADNVILQEINFKHMKIVKHVPFVLIALAFILSFIATEYMIFAGVPMPQNLPKLLVSFNDAFIGSGMVHVIKVLELIAAICLLIPQKRTLGLVIATPIIINILLVDTLMGGMLIGPGLVLFILNFWALYIKRHAVKMVLSN
jgi:hypothetical protein